jgi:hypothetical protein
MFGEHCLPILHILPPFACNREPPLFKELAKQPPHPPAADSCPSPSSALLPLATPAHSHVTYRLLSPTTESHLSSWGSYVSIPFHLRQRTSSLQAAVHNFNANHSATSGVTDFLLNANHSSTSGATHFLSNTRQSDYSPVCRSEYSFAKDRPLSHAGPLLTPALPLPTLSARLPTWP